MTFAKYVFILVTLMLINSCGVPSIIKKNMYCYSGRETRLDSLLNINGYYKELTAYPSKGNYNSKELDSFFNYFIFFEDGIFLDGIRINQQDTVKFKVLHSDSIQAAKDEFYRWGNWGHYIIAGDTIKAQCMYRYGGIVEWYAREIWFKVIDKSTIKKINFFLLDENITSKYVFIYDSVNKKNLENVYPAKFVPLSVMPPSKYCWLRKKKWFWCK